MVTTGPGGCQAASLAPTCRHNIRNLMSLRDRYMAWPIPGQLPTPPAHALAAEA